MHTLPIALLALSLAGSSTLLAQQQVADTDFHPPIANPAYAKEKGPVVLVDEAHHNFHTATGRFAPFARLLGRDGYVVKPSRAPFSKDLLATAKVLVIANALNKKNVENWTLPTPSAFSNVEIQVVRKWVESGGSLLLIADHMPFPGAAEQLAKQFGVLMSNGYAGTDKGTNIVFARTEKKGDDDALARHAITLGRNDDERVTRVKSFTGTSFHIGKGATSLMTLPAGSRVLEPREAGKLSSKTPQREVGGWSQGAVLRFGAGRVAVFGEAAMFTAQLMGNKKRPVGMNDPVANQNAQFVLNVLHWLSGVLDK